MVYTFEVNPTINLKIANKTICVSVSIDSMLVNIAIKMFAIAHIVKNM